MRRRGLTLIELLVILGLLLLLLAFLLPILGRVRGQAGRASSQNNLARQFWGDYNTLVSTSDSAYFIYTDSRHGTGCATVDAYQHDLSTTKPAPCSTSFGDTDIFVSKVTP